MMSNTDRTKNIQNQTTYNKHDIIQNLKRTMRPGVLVVLFVEVTNPTYVGMF